MERDGFDIVRVCTTEEASRLSQRLMEAGDDPYCQAMWDVRRLVHHVFAKLWGTPDLLTSFDGHGVRAPFTSWHLPWHVDQGATHPDGRVCVQALLALTPVDETTGGTVFLRGSHATHASWIKKVDTSADPRAYESFLVSRRMNALSVYDSVFPSLKAGELLLFDSRVVHRVAAPRRRSSLRHVAYVSMTPTAKADPNVLRLRRRAARLGIRTTHWPHRFIDRGGTRVGGKPWAKWASDEKTLIAGGVNCDDDN